MGKEPLNTKLTLAMRENTNDRYWPIVGKSRFFKKRDAELGLIKEPIHHC